MSACAFWAARFYREVLRKKELAEGGNKSFVEERRRLTKARADLTELELAKQRGELIPIDFYRELTAAHCMTLRQNFLLLPSRIAHQLEGENRATIKEKLNQAVRGILTALSQGGYNPLSKVQGKI